MKTNKKNTLKILNSYVRVHENHTENLLQRSRLATQDFTSFAATSFEKIRTIDTSFLEVVTSHFAKIYLCIEFVQQLAALLCKRIKILLQQVVGERSHENKEFCAGGACTINNFIPRSIN